MQIEIFFTLVLVTATLALALGTPTLVLWGFLSAGLMHGASTTEQVLLIIGIPVIPWLILIAAWNLASVKSNNRRQQQESTWIKNAEEKLASHQGAKESADDVI